jgi:hypothetical protein
MKKHPPSRIGGERGWCCCRNRQETPPSRVSSKGGGGGVVTLHVSLTRVGSERWGCDVRRFTVLFRARQQPYLGGDHVNDLE